LARGQRLTEILKQGQYSPLPVEKQVLIIYAGNRGYLDPIPIAEVRNYEKKLTDTSSGPTPASWPRSMTWA
jgi:F-type H+-transporting ATPase subunit alpha